MKAYSPTTGRWTSVCRELPETERNARIKFCREYYSAYVNYRHKNGITGFAPVEKRMPELKLAAE